MSEPLKSIHVRLSPEAHKVLSALAESEDKDNAEMARLIIEEAIFGRVHTYTVTARRFQGAGFAGILGDLAGGKGK